jgi:hypothetical protein
MNYTEEQKADILERVKLTKAAMEEIFKKHNTSISSHPVMVPTQDGHFVTRVDIQIVDQKFVPVTETKVVEAEKVEE